MPTTPANALGGDPHLSARTLAWLVTTPGPIAALWRVLTTHQPTSAGRCPTCRRATWRRRPFPCIVWHQIHGELLGVFTGGGHRQPRH